MDFFQRVGNFFTGAGWVSDEEERRKKKQPQPKKPVQRTPQQKQRIENVFQKATKPQPITLDGKPKQAPKPQLQIAKPAQAPTVTVAPRPTQPVVKIATPVKPVAKDVKKASPDKLGAMLKTLQTMKKDADNAVDSGVKTVKAVAANPGETAMAIGKSILDIPANIKDQLIMTKKIGDIGGQLDDRKLETLRKFAEQDLRAGKTSKAEYQQRIARLDKLGSEIKRKTKEEETKRQREYNPDSVALEIASVGLGSEGLAVLGKVLGKVKAGAKKATEEAAESAVIDTTRTNRVNQREADTAIKRGETRTEAIVDNTPAFNKDRVLTIKEPSKTELPTVDDLAEISPFVIQKRTTERMREITDDPNLTPEQKKVEVEKVKNLYAEVMAKIEANQKATGEVVETAAKTAADEQAERMAMVDDIQKKQAEQNAPVNVGATPAKVVESKANDPYQRFNETLGIADNTDDIDYIKGQQTAERIAGNKTADELLQKQEFRIPSAINNKTQGKVADAMTGGAGTVAGKMLTSQNPILNFFGQLAYGLNKKSTLNNNMKTLVEQIQGRRGGVGEGLRNDLVTKLEEPLSGMDEAAQVASRENVFKAFELYNNDQIDEALDIIKQFNPAERQYFDNIRELNTLRNNLNRSVMSGQTVDRYNNGMHMPRIFDQDAFSKEFTPDDIEAFAISRNRTLDLNPNKRRKQLEELSEELRETMLRDPAQASVIRTDIALHNRAVSEYSSKVAQIPGAVADKNVRGFIQIPEMAKYGSLAGKYVRRDLAEPMLDGSNRFKSDTYKHVDALLNKYQSSILGKLENGLRKVLTVYNPATRLGNRAANLSQGSMAGFNIAEMGYQQQHFMNVLKNGGDEWTRLAKTYGAIDDSEALARFSGVVSEAKTKVGKRLSESYTDMDAGAKVAMFQWRVRKGDTPEQAARFVNRALPNIGNSGEIYSFFSRLPILGIPFRAIQPEVLRALASTASRNTVPFLVAMTTYTTLQNLSWEGVPEEERKQIQERFGSGQTPFAGLNRFAENELGVETDKVLPSSWSFNAGGLFDTDPEDGKTAIVDVDPRRLMGMYSINTGGDTAADGIFDTLAKVSPAPVPVTFKDGEFALAPQNIISSRLFGAPYQALIDKDFRGRSIQDPESDNANFVNPETGQPDKKSNPMRAMEFLLRSYLPQANDVANVYDAKEGKENFYQQKMNPAQAIARLFGLKGEVFDEKRLQKMKDQAAYFEDVEQIERELEGMSPAAQAAYKRLTGYDKLREQVPNEFEEGSMRWKKAPVYDFSEDKWKDYAAHPELYQLMVDKKQREAAKDGKPIQPEFDPRLSDSFRKQLIQNKMVAPGDDAELDQRMYSSSEYDYYMELKDQYKEQAKQYYGESDENDEYVDELVKHQGAKFPKKPDILKAYGAAYAEYTKGLRDKPAFNDELKAAKEEYNQATFNWTNNERKARGLPAITWDMWNNPTFGYDESPSGGFGKGWGFGGGGGGGREREVNTLGQITNLASDIPRLKETEVQAMPNLEDLIEALYAAQSGGRQKPRLGASSRGQG